VQAVRVTQQSPLMLLRGMPPRTLSEQMETEQRWCEQESATCNVTAHFFALLRDGGFDWREAARRRCALLRARASAACPLRTARVFFIQRHSVLKSRDATPRPVRSARV